MGNLAVPEHSSCWSRIAVEEQAQTSCEDGSGHQGYETEPDSLQDEGAEGVLLGAKGLELTRCLCLLLKAFQSLRTCR